MIRGIPDMVSGPMKFESVEPVQEKPEKALPAFVAGFVLGGLTMFVFLGAAMFLGWLMFGR